MRLGPILPTGAAVPNLWDVAVFHSLADLCKPWKPSQLRKSGRQHLGAPANPSLVNRDPLIIPKFMNSFMWLAEWLAVIVPTKHTNCTIDVAESKT